MKKTISFLSLFLLAFSTNAQWTDSGNNITTSDNVGIGTTDPEGTLQVNGVSEASSSSTLNGNLILSSSSTGLVNTFGIHASTNGVYSWIQSGHKSSSSTYDLALNPRGGNVGIGTTDPEGKLQVNGVSEASSSSTLNGNLILSSSSTGLVNTFGIHASTNDVYSWIQSGHKSNSSTFDLALNPRGGNVGIGTTNPDSKLAVNGNIHTKEVKVDLVGWPDYVFEEEYNLPSLEEVETHIEENGHLQGIPSAKEVEANGIKLGEMDSKLLQKIEELMLYTIQQQKEIEKLKEQNIQLMTAIQRLK